jgi:hypothetical protein
MNTDFYTDFRDISVPGPEQDRAARLVVVDQLVNQDPNRPWVDTAREIHETLDMLGLLPGQEGSRDSARFPLNLTPKESSCTPKDKNSVFIP